ncbi:MAG TPA: beta-L-arabinofuranosidase domain-containing protein [Puia sp.]|nr:beta-L-arabinofuranosidase domain-containing protein [Puia sp.]
MSTIPALTLACFISLTLAVHAQSEAPAGQYGNLAAIAAATGSNRPSSSLEGLNDGVTPTPPGDRWYNRAQQRRGTQWVQYEWRQPVHINRIDLFFWDYGNMVRLPQAYRITWWDGSRWAPVSSPEGLGLVNDKYNTTTFNEVTTTRLRLELDSADRRTSTLVEWKVPQPPGAPDYPPIVNAGEDRDMVTGGRTWLSGSTRSINPVTAFSWSQVSGPGKAAFADAHSARTTATFSAAGDYVLSFTVRQGGFIINDSLMVKVRPRPKDKRLDVVYTKHYSIDSKLWNDRVKNIIVNWIPYCIDQIERSDLTTGEGGLDNFIEAAKALRGQHHGPHKGYVFSNAWVHQTVESMCEALMVDPKGDGTIIAAQEKMKKTLEKWIPIILSAQEPDGYLQTAYTLRDTSKWHSRWSPEGRGNHEGYVSGYFIESAINHYTLTEGKDKRLYNAAKRLAGCWVNNIGPGKIAWYDGHQEMEQALVRFGRFVNDMEGNGRGDSYIQLAKFLLDNRNHGSEYDQSHVPVQQQYEAVGHAVRATYTYSGMADVAAETRDEDYQSAVLSLWDNMVNKKYYVTGGIGSGETSEGFGPDYSLGNNAYCESCSSCGLIFFQYKMSLAYHDAKYADLYEETMYNALLGSLSLDGKDFYYTNALAASQGRYQWHVCPCCVGNIPRTLLMMPTWTYVRGDDGLYVNMYIGSTMRVEKVVGTDIIMTQQTDYPWSGRITLTIDPQQANGQPFTLHLRIPDRTTSALYTPKPAISGYRSISVNGQPQTPSIENGYVAIRRVWKKGDRIVLELPMGIQRITADKRIEADRGRVALRYGPLLYNVETADRQDINKAIGTGPLTLEWKGDLLHGVMAIKGTWADGTPLLAIPNYARLNRAGTTPYPQQTADRTPASIVWIKQ